MVVVIIEDDIGPRTAPTAVLEMLADRVGTVLWQGTSHQHDRQVGIVGNGTTIFKFNKLSLGQIVVPTSDINGINICSVGKEQRMSFFSSEIRRNLIKA